jgi:CheY-like chemotaxis protein
MMMNGGNKTYSVLVVEDDPQNLKFLKLLLSKYFSYPLKTIKS